MEEFLGRVRHVPEYPCWLTDGPLEQHPAKRLDFMESWNRLEGR